ncbi:MAG: hypothetical protein JOY54_10815 [Acidobacteriaceae bacterium]|nr:hypothetical protein [Acidobacteriaceae bacterium]
MISKHIDLIAIGLLLLALAFSLHVRSVAVFECGTPHRITINSRSAGSVIVVPPAPHLPSVPLTRD